ncbi:Yip1-domain-containing protein [Auriscalpium vulgare]|uniref:Yip1-domain-containing protein n=1 Tax=Auriscalpium vulgare TaxID=40419 RepID=A0ACB8S123_9AGAM|nr:Yip1-domain-containing protein [Auriscalpium vulgare]
MAGYVSIEADDRLEEQPDLEFKTFEAPATNEQHGVGRANRGYIADAQRSTSFWSLDYYQTFFDVDTKTVLFRCINTLNPLSPTYTSAHLNPAPDLYGPFWTLTTLIFALFITSSLAHSIVSYLSDDPVSYDFALLSVAMGLVYTYGIGVPVILWGVLRYGGIIGTGGEGWGLVEAVGVWGYAMFVWIPVSILCIIPIRLVRWILTGVAFGLSGYFLVRNVYPVLASADQKAVRLLIVIVAALHAALALVFKVMFFSYYIIREDDPKKPISTSRSFPR